MLHLFLSVRCYVHVGTSHDRIILIWLMNLWELSSSEKTLSICSVVNLLSWTQFIQISETDARFFFSSWDNTAYTGCSSTYDFILYSWLEIDISRCFIPFLYFFIWFSLGWNKMISTVKGVLITWVDGADGDCWCEWYRFHWVCGNYCSANVANVFHISSCLEISLKKNSNLLQT